MMNDYKNICDRCRAMGIDIDAYDVYIYPNNLNGVECLKGTLSHDGHWFCIPEKQYVAEYGDDDYVPVCHEIAGSYSTYLKGDMLYVKTNFYLLYKERKRNE